MSHTPLLLSLKTLLDSHACRELSLDADENKPLDFGMYGITGSVTLDGQIIAINTYHPVHGYVTMTSAPPFDESKRYDQDAVRAYRKSLAAQTGFGLRFTVPIRQREAWLIEDAVPYLRLTLENGIVAHCVTFVPESVPVGVIQWWSFEGERASMIEIEGEMRLQRSAYTQLTEGGVLPMPPSHTITQLNRAGYDGIGCVVNNHIGWAVCVGTLLPDRRFDLKRGMLGAIRFEMLDGSYEEKLTPEQFEERSLSKQALIFGLMDGHQRGMPGVLATQNYMALTHHTLPDLLKNSLTAWTERWKNWPFAGHPLEAVARRGLVYGLTCSVPVATRDDDSSPLKDAVCILTDHMLLPLSWNRDAYYVAVAMLYWGYDFRRIVRGHLIWMFEVAERVDGAWGRSYLANGKIKDRGFQLDQQIFPLLELAEYVLKTGDRELLDRLMPALKKAVNHLLDKRDSSRWLFPTDETPADDPIAMPYHFSSHVLLWYTFTQLARLDIGGNFMPMAEAVRVSLETHFVVEVNGVELYAYAVDGQGGYHLYHDANDIPLVLMPLWEYCTADAPLWRNTIRFAFSEANSGVFDGHLGSVHTPAPWPLGDIQQYIAADLTGDDEALLAAQDAILHAAQIDGGLPEAYNVQDGRVRSRHWFAWTNAMLVYYLYLKRRNERRG